MPTSRISIPGVNAHRRCSINNVKVPWYHVEDILCILIELHSIVALNEEQL